MTKFLYWSDLHTEHGIYTFPGLDEVTDVDALLFAGDIGTRWNQIDLMASLSVMKKVPVIFVPGNHEYWTLDWETFDQEQASRIAAVNSAHGSDLRVLNEKNPVTYVKDTRIVGSTLWCDFTSLEKHYAIPQAIALQVYERDVNDCSKVRHGINQLRGAHVIQKHNVQKKAILQELSEKHNGPTIVMTHHMPLIECLNINQFRPDPMSASFASNLRETVQNLDFDVWIYGHSHKPIELDIYGEDEKPRSFRSNALGYPFDTPCPQFNDLRWIDTGKLDEV